MHKTMANIVYLIYRVQKFSEAQLCTPRSLYICICGTLHLSAQVSRVNNVVGDIWGGICGGLIISGNYFSFSSDTYKACPFKITSSSQACWNRDSWILLLPFKQDIFVWTQRGWRGEGGGFPPICKLFSWRNP